MHLFDFFPTHRYLGLDVSILTNLPRVKIPWEYTVSAFYKIWLFSSQRFPLNCLFRKQQRTTLRYPVRVEIIQSAFLTVSLSVSVCLPLFPLLFSICMFLSPVPSGCERRPLYRSFCFVAAFCNALSFTTTLNFVANVLPSLSTETKIHQKLFLMCNKPFRYRLLIINFIVD